MEVLDKGKAAAVTTVVETRNKATGELVFENQSTVFIRGAGGFGGKRNGKGMSIYRVPEHLTMNLQTADLPPLPMPSQNVHLMQSLRRRLVNHRLLSTGKSGWLDVVSRLL
jgi:hypothetical protein